MFVSSFYNMFDLIKPTCLDTALHVQILNNDCVSPLVISDDIDVAYLDNTGLAFIRQTLTN